ncbi:hypothetical protein, partial [Nonomuraea turkmeniaca]|uniref:hypothetical protein n=1 Tax=Nonomuraea turkmeniaca TaxID=103838 RepID=UPI001B85FE20
PLHGRTPHAPPLHQRTGTPPEANPMKAQLIVALIAIAIAAVAAVAIVWITNRARDARATRRTLQRTQAALDDVYKIAAGALDLDNSAALIAARIRRHYDQIKDSHR